jgi:hypothetical protein
MDAFKAAEIERMRLGGNKPWRDFFDAAESNKMAGIRYAYSFLNLGSWKWGSAIFLRLVEALDGLDSADKVTIAGMMPRSQNDIRAK